MYKHHYCHDGAFRQQHLHDELFIDDDLLLKIARFIVVKLPALYCVLTYLVRATPQSHHLHICACYCVKERSRARENERD